MPKRSLILHQAITLKSIDSKLLCVEEYLRRINERSSRLFTKDSLKGINNKFRLNTAGTLGWNQHFSVSGSYRDYPSQQLELTKKREVFTWFSNVAWNRNPYLLYLEFRFQYLYVRRVQNHSSDNIYLWWSSLLDFCVYVQNCRISY